ncbi:hypothetical protein ACFL6T_07385 [Candidatus Zixiibacteriota bacterium]
MPTRRKKFINRWLTWITLGISLSAFWILFGEPKSPAADPDFYGDQYVEDLSLGVLDFTADGVEVSEATEITDRLRSYLRRTRRMYVPMKNEVDYAIDMGGESAADIEIGKHLRADLIITGTVSQEGRRYQLDAKITDVSSGLPLGQCHTEASGFENFLKQVTETMAETLASALQGG